MLFWLEIATGFTGALTLVWLARVAARRFFDLPSVEPLTTAGTGLTEASVRYPKPARLEVLVLAAKLASKPLADALLEAKNRGARVEIIVDRTAVNDPDSVHSHLAEQNLTPMQSPTQRAVRGGMVLIDRRLLLTSDLGFTQKDEAEIGAGLVVTGYSQVMQAFHKHFEAVKAQIKIPGENKSTPQEKAA